MIFEQSFLKEEMEGTAVLQKQLHMPVCLGEGEEIGKADGAGRTLALGICGIISINLLRVGEFMETLRMCRICDDHGIGLCVGTMPELGVGSAAEVLFACHLGLNFPTDVAASCRLYVDEVLMLKLTVADG